MGHLFDNGIAFGVDSRVVERVFGLGNAQESGTLLEGYGSQSRHLLQFSAAAECPMFAAIVYDVLRQ